MHLKALFITPLVVLTALAASSNTILSERDFETLDELTEREVESRAPDWFYAGGGGCLTSWSGQCYYTCQVNIREDYPDCVLVGTKIARFGCFPGWSKCKCDCA